MRIRLLGDVDAGGSAPSLPRPDHSANVPLTSLPTEYNTLPTVSIIVPNQINDMHHGNDPEAIQAGDRWLREHLDAFVQWAQEHNSLLIVTGMRTIRKRTRL